MIPVPRAVTVYGVPEGKCVLMIASIVPMLSTNWQTCAQILGDSVLLVLFFKFLIYSHIHTIRNPGTYSYLFLQQRQKPHPQALRPFNFLVPGLPLVLDLESVLMENAFANHIILEKIAQSEIIVSIFKVVLS